MSCSNCACSASPEVSSSSFVPPLVALKGLNLQLIQENGELSQQQVPSESLWQDQDCLIYLVRRPGCILCRVSDYFIMKMKTKFINYPIPILYITLHIVFDR